MKLTVLWEHTVHSRKIELPLVDNNVYNNAHQRIHSTHRLKVELQGKTAKAL